MAVSTSLELMAQEFFQLLDAKRFDDLLDRSSDDVQGVDEISRGWIRGREGMRSYLRDLDDQVDDIHSTLRDMKASEWGDAGLVTGVLEQSYMMAGARQDIVAPTSLGFRREASGWKVALIHSVPLPEPET